MSDVTIINEVTVQQIDHGQGAAAHAQVIVMIPVADANRLAQHMIDRGDGTILAAEAKEVAVPAVQALVDAGYKEPT